VVLCCRLEGLVARNVCVERDGLRRSGLDAVPPLDLDRAEVTRGGFWQRPPADVLLPQGGKPIPPAGGQVQVSCTAVQPRLKTHGFESTSSAEDICFSPSMLPCRQQ